MIDSGTTKLFRPTRKDSARYSMLFHKITGIQIKPTTTGPPLRPFGWSHINEARKCIIIIHAIYSQSAKLCKFAKRWCDGVAWRLSLALISLSWITGFDDILIRPKSSGWILVKTLGVKGGACWEGGVGGSVCVGGQSCFWSGVRQNAHLHPRDEGKELPRKLKLV